MKKLSSILLILMTIFFIACEKDKENVVIKSSITANDLANLDAATYVLLMDNAADTFQVFSWTAVDYGFTAAQTYVLQFDLKTNNFSTPVTLKSVTHVTEAGVTVGDMNKMLLAAGIAPGAATDIQFRIKTTIHDSIPAVYSDISEAKLTPYATVFPPLYLCGKATGGWAWDLYTYKEVRSPSANVYETTSYFINTDADCTFRLFKQIGWGDAYNALYFTGIVTPLLENANDGDKNFRFLGTTGYYKITFNLTAKSVSMVSVAEPVLYATGAALGGWDWTTNYIQLTWKSNGIFKATTDFAVETFRFFLQAGWGDSYNYPWFAGGTVSPLFENANDGDKNFKFIGTPGSYTITVNLLDKIVTMTQP